MKKPRLDAIEYIRGISMLGVIGIHVGSQYLLNQSCNPHLVALFEVFTRFSVPIFFFISAFGLFYNLDMTKPLDYKSFLIRRGKTVIIPYIAWSFFYIFHYCFLWQDFHPLNPFTITFDLIFGTASYQLYFMVILIWFYMLMPLWVWMVRKATYKKLAILLILQIAFDYYSSYILNPYGIQNYFLRTILEWRLNYWVLHYVFIFILGGYLAVKSGLFKNIMKKHRGMLTIFFWASMVWLLSYYYRLMSIDHYTPLEAINTAHQLSPAGIFYTIGASLFFFTLFTYWRLPNFLRPILSLLGRHSYFAYLAHPIAITYLAIMLQQTGHIMTAPLAIVFYIAVVVLSVGAAVIMRKIGTKLPIINKLTIGVYPKK